MSLTTYSEVEMPQTNEIKKIVLFDDDPTMRTLLETLLGMEGFSAKAYIEKQGDDFVEFVRAEKPDVVLLDVHLTYSSGVDLLTEIRSDEQLKDMHVLMTSGMDMKAICLQAGADGFLLKPYMPDELISWLHEIFKQN
jgi:DNA-binding response OmpR family regulator